MTPQTEHRLITSRLSHKSILFTLSLSLIFTPIGAIAQTDKDLIQLEAGKPIEREMKAGEIHSYQITLSANQFLRMIVNQRGIDVVVVLFGPDGKQMTEIDSPNGTQGPEPVSLITPVGGRYRLDIRSLEKGVPAGRYEVKIEEIRPATSQDGMRIAAERAFEQAQKLRFQGTAKSLRESLQKYEEALPMLRALGDRRAEAATLNNIGLVYSSLGEKQKALDVYNQALVIRKAMGDRQGESSTLNNIGAVYDFLGERQQALDFYNQALTIRRAIGDRGFESITLNNIGLVYDLLGERQKGLDFYNQALVIKRAIGDRRGEAVTLNNIGSVYFALGENQKALDFYNQALPLRRAVGDRSGEAVTLNNIGLVYDLLGERQKALDFYNQALSLREAVGDGGGEATTLNNIGLVYDSLGEKQKALDFYNQSLTIIRKVGDRNGEAFALNNIGGVYNSLGDKQKTLDFYNQALSLSRAVGNASLEAKILHSIARVELGQNNPVAAHANIKAAVEIIESLRTKVASPESRASYFASAQAAYDFYISLLMRLHQDDPTQGRDALALGASERARARTLLELLAEARADIRQSVAPALLEREKSLGQLIDDKTERQVRLLSGKHTEQQAADAKKEINDLLSQYQEVQAQIRAASPRYAALTQPQPLTLKQIQQEIVDTDTLLLEYALGDEHSYLWAVTPDSIETFELPKREVIEKAAQRLYELVTVRNRFDSGLSLAQWQAQLSQSEAEYEKAAAELSRMILGPAAPMLGKKRLLIVADGALNYVPFAALPAPAVVRPDSGEGIRPALTQEHEIINLPSASSLAVLRKQLVGRKPAPKAAAVFADPVFDANDPRVKASAKPKSQKPHSSRDQQAINAAGAPVTSPEDISTLALIRSANEVGVSDKGNFTRLPFTRQEAEAIYAVTKQNGAMKVLDFDANRETASSPDLSQYRVVHFATHGVLNSEHPELSGIVLSRVDKQGNPQNGFFRLVNVYNMNLSADLVVLSACQTALGKRVRGEGLIGLTRGFMYAGAARVVASLWKVGDDATAELMKKFYVSMMKQGQRPAAALRSAQIWMQKQRRWRSPHYWAGFVLQGEWK